MIKFCLQKKSLVWLLHCNKLSQKNIILKKYAITGYKLDLVVVKHKLSDSYFDTSHEKENISRKLRHTGQLKRSSLDPPQTLPSKKNKLCLLVQFGFQLFSASIFKTVFIFNSA